VYVCGVCVCVCLYCILLGGGMDESPQNDYEINIWRQHIWATCTQDTSKQTNIDKLQHYSHVWLSCSPYMVVHITTMQYISWYTLIKHLWQQFGPLIWTQWGWHVQHVNNSVIHHWYGNNIGRILWHVQRMNIHHWYENNVGDLHSGCAWDI